MRSCVSCAGRNCCNPTAPAGGCRPRRTWSAACRATAPHHVVITHSCTALERWPGPCVDIQRREPACTRCGGPAAEGLRLQQGGHTGRPSIRAANRGRRHRGRYAVGLAELSLMTSFATFAMTAMQQIEAVSSTNELLRTISFATIAMTAVQQTEADHQKIAIGNET